jgi:biotin operon repressor
VLYQLSYLPLHLCTYVTITQAALAVNGVPQAQNLGRYAGCGLPASGTGVVEFSIGNSCLRLKRKVLPAGDRPIGTLATNWDMQTPHPIQYGPDGSSVELEPRSPSLRLPLARLLQLLMILQSERFPNARRLADACAVSRRTIYRDLATLEAAGIAVLYQPQRQGYQLARDRWLQPTQLEDNEALALLIMSRLGGAGAPFGLLRHARSGLVKLVQALPAELRGRITMSSELIPDNAAALELAPDRQSIHETVLTALSRRRRLSLWHREHELSRVRSTKLSLYRLARIRGQWSLVGYSSADR